MGLEHTKVLPVKEHLNEFTCALCMKIVSLDAVVTSCHHTFCKNCLESYIDCQGTSCPTCRNKIVKADGCSGAKPLELAEPLAFRILGRIKVVCPHRNKASNCSWSGNYGDLRQHTAAYHKPGQNETMSRSSSKRSLVPSPPPPMLQASVSMTGPTMSPPRLRQNSSEYFGALPPMKSTGGGHPLERAQSAPRSRLPTVSVARQRDGKAERSIIEISERPSPRSSNSSSEFRVTSDRAYRKDKKSQRQVMRSLTPKKKSPGANGSRSQRLKGFQAAENSVSSRLTRSRSEATAESSSSDFATIGPAAKENGNTAFKGKNYHEAIVLYTEGITAFRAIKHPSEEDRAMVSSLYGNRAAAYLKSKRFDQCIRDSDRALKVNKHLTKVCLRKAWALIELGKLNEACETLSESLANNPGSKDLQFELFETKKLVAQKSISVV